MGHVSSLRAKVQLRDVFKNNMIYRQPDNNIGGTDPWGTTEGGEDGENE